MMYLKGIVPIKALVYKCANITEQLRLSVYVVNTDNVFLDLRGLLIVNMGVTILRNSYIFF